MTTFVDDVLAGRTTLDRVDDYVDRWHDGDSEGELRDFLGLSPAEYDAWIADAGALTKIVSARRGNARRHAAA